MRKRRKKKNRIIKGITYYMGFLFYFSLGGIETQSKFALVTCLISATWILSVFHGSLLLREENEQKKAVSEDVLH